MNSFFKLPNKSPKLGFNDVLIKPIKSQISDISKVNLQINMPFKMENRTIGWSGVPIISSNKYNVTNLNTFNVLKEYDYMSCFPNYFNEYFLNITEIPKELYYTDHYIISCGLSDYVYAIQLIDRLRKDYGISVKFFCLDIPNGYISELQDISLTIRNYYPELIIIAGNVVTPDITYDLIKYSGVNIVKCGLINSPEKVLKTGIGYPQISAIMECADAAHEADGYLISDGGIRTTADLTKAFAAGADMVMAGGIFLNHLESPGDMCTLNGVEISQKNNNNKPLKSTILDINKNLKTACTYVNADNLDDFYLNSQFITIT